MGLDSATVEQSVAAASAVIKGLKFIARLPVALALASDKSILPVVVRFVSTGPVDGLHFAFFRDIACFPVFQLPARFPDLPPHPVGGSEGRRRWDVAQQVDVWAVGFV